LIISIASCPSKESARFAVGYSYLSGLETVGGRHEFFPEGEVDTIEYSIEDTYRGLYQGLRGYIGKPTDGRSKSRRTSRATLLRMFSPGPLQVAAPTHSTHDFLLANPDGVFHL
jgi:hypothetical protein